MKSVLENKLINRWNLFWLVTFFLSLANISAMMRVDLTRIDGDTRIMIQSPSACPRGYYCLLII